MAGRSRIAARFAPLVTALGAEKRDEVILTFTAIEAIIGAPLPLRLRIDSGDWTHKTLALVQAVRAAGWWSGLRPQIPSVAFRRLPVAPEGPPRPSRDTPLVADLATQAGDAVTLRFAAIAAIIGAPLPVSAQVAPSYWTSAPTLRLVHDLTVNPSAINDCAKS